MARICVCKRENSATAAYCVGCGERLPPDGPQITGGNRWQRNPGEFAVRIESRDLNAVLDKGLAVDEGTQGMLFQDGRFVGQLGPGKHTMESVADRLKNLVRTAPFHAVLVDIGDVALHFSSDTLLSRDGQNVAFELTLAIQMADPNDFYVNFMKGQKLILDGHLRARLEPLLAGSISAIVRRTDAADLTVLQADLKQQFEQSIFESIKEILSSLGLHLSRIERLAFTNELLDVTHQEQAERSRELQQIRQRQEFEAQKLQLDTRWNRFIADMASDETRHTMDSIKSDAELEQFRTEIDQKLKEFHAGVDLENRISELGRTLRWEGKWLDYRDWKEDRELHREHMVAKLQFERDAELATLEHRGKLRDLQYSHQLSDIERSHAQQVADEEFERDQKRQRAEFDAELERQARLRAEQNNTFRDDLDNQLAGAETEATIRTIKHGGDKQEALDGIEIYRKYKDAKRENRAELQKLKLEKKAADLQREQEEKDAEHRRIEQAKDGDSRRHLDELKQFSEMSCEALIAAAPADRAAMLLELRKTESFQKLSEEQILAMAAEKSPAVAEALGQKFRAAAQADAGMRQRESELYDRMLDEQKAGTAQLLETQRQNNQLMQQLITSVLGSQRDVGIAAATGQAPVTPPSTNVPPVNRNRSVSSPSTSGETSLVKCSACGELTATDSQYCGVCGRRFNPPGKARVGF